jgi:hypothetical protein
LARKCFQVGWRNNELIKNAYDADANICALFLTSMKKSCGLLTMAANGRGDCKKAWMSIGFSDKDVDIKSDKGRIKPR